jgi:[protein-PII] uridylyltransferase
MSNVKDAKNLKLLYIVTYADINGVGGNAYNSFKKSLENNCVCNSLRLLERSIICL